MKNRTSTTRKPSPAPTLSSAGVDSIVEQPSDSSGTSLDSLAVRPVGSSADSISAEELRERISRRAYELAEQRGFSSGAHEEDWLQAEREITGT